MTLPTFARPTAVLATVLLALVGCGKAEPTKSDTTKPTDTTGAVSTPPTDAAPTHSTATTPLAPVPPGPAALQPHAPAHEAAQKFIADLRAAVEKGGPLPDDLLKRVSPAFLKVIGKPTLTPDDKQRGYSAEAAGAWLLRAGAGLTGIGLPAGSGSPTAAVLVGSVNNGSGRYLLRVVPADGGWVVDWFGLGSARDATTRPTAADPFQEFAAQAFLDALTGGVPARDDRVLLLGALLSSQARAADWAAPFGQDKERGYDFSPSKLADLADKLGGGITAYALTPSGPDQFKVELTRSRMTSARTLKLVKGSNPGEWLVDEFVPQ